MEDIVKSVLNPDLNLPLFYATDLSRLPPTDANHCDMSAVLLELQAVHREVRDLKRLEQEVFDLREQLSRAERCTSIEQGTAERMVSKSNCDFPPLIGTVTVAENGDVPSENGKYSQFAKELHERHTLTEFMKLDLNSSSIVAILIQQSDSVLALFEFSLHRKNNFKFINLSVKYLRWCPNWCPIARYVPPTIFNLDSIVYIVCL